MTSNTPVFDLTLEQKRTELVLLGFEKEAMHPSMDSTALSRLLANARINPRPIYAGLDIFEKYVSTASAESSQREEITFTRVSLDEAQEKLNLPSEPDRVLKCPRCDAAMHMYYKRNTSDGYCGVQYANYICSNLSCALNIERYYEGYGSIFD